MSLHKKSALGILIRTETYKGRWKDISNWRKKDLIQQIIELREYGEII